jgi:hypothetical protein
MEELRKSYYAIIPASVRYDKNLCANAKLLYGEITALCNEKGYCWAKNNYFAQLYNVHKDTISKWISQLVKRNYIKLNIINDKNNRVTTERQIYIIDEKSYTPRRKERGGIDEKSAPPLDEKSGQKNITKENNTVNNNGAKKIALKDELYDKLLKAFNAAYEKINHEKPNFVPKDYILIRKIVSRALKQSTDTDCTAEDIIKNKLDMLLQKCISDKTNFWTFTPGKLEWGWNELVNNKISKLKYADPFEYSRRMGHNV